MSATVAVRVTSAWEGTAIFQMMSLSGLEQLDGHAFRFFFTERESIAADFKFQRVSQWGIAQQFDFFTINESHFHQPHGDRVITLDIDYSRPITRF